MENNGWLLFFKMMAAEEAAAYEKYEMARQMADSPELKKLLERLRDEENFHKQVLEGEYQRLVKQQ